MKVHVRKGSESATGLPVPACAFNNARGYNALPESFVKSPKEFRATPSEDRCQLCEFKYLAIRNAQRKAKNLAPVLTAFEGLDSA